MKKFLYNKGSNEEKQKGFSNYTCDKELITSICKALQNFVPNPQIIQLENRLTE